MPGKYEAPRPVKTRTPPKTLHPVLAALLSVLFALTGIAAAAAALWLGVHYADAKPILLTPPDAANARLEQMLDAVCQGEYDAASGYSLGTPDLGADAMSEDALSQLLWESFVSSMDYQLVGECYTTDEGLAQDITFTYLDMTSVTENLRARSHAMLEQRVAAAEDISEVYDENNEYREDFVMDILNDTARDALAEDARMKTVELTVNLKYQDGFWWIVADTALLDAISGGILF